MIAYLDTQVVIWLMQGEPKKISRDAKRLMDTSDLVVSAMVTVELEVLYELRRIKMQWPEIHTNLRSEIGVEICTLPCTRIADIARNESWTRDPFDRLIVANAKANGLAYLISADEHIRKHYQRAVW